MTLSPGAPDGLLIFSHAGDDRRTCVEYVRERLGLTDLFRREARPALLRPMSPNKSGDVDRARRIERATALWREGRDPRGTVVERYLAGRALHLPDDVAGAVLRYHAACPWRDDDGAVVTVPAMLAAMRDVRTDELVAIQRTALRPDGSKIGRKMLGPAGGAAIKLDPDELVTTGLTIGEGAETCLSARQLGFRPVWALGSAGAISGFPVLSGIEALTLLEEADQASARAVAVSAERWHAASREVAIVRPSAGSDINDAIREMAA